MDNRSKYLLKNVISFTFGKLGSKLITFVLVPLYPYALSTEEYGTVDLITTVCTVLMPILILNIGEAVMRFCLDQGVDQRKIMSTGVMVLLGGTLFGAALIPISGFIPAISQYGLYVYAYVISAAYMQVFLCYLRGKEMLNAYAVGNIIHTAINAGLNILFLVVLHWGISGYLLANIISCFLTAVYAAVIGRADKVILAFKIDRELSLAMIRFSVVLIPNSFMWWIINSSDRVMITAMIGAAANGVYAVAYKIPSLLSTLSGIFNQAWSYSAIKEEGSADKTEYHNEMYNNMVQILTVITAGMLMIMKPFMSVYVASEYYTAWMYTPYLLVGFVFLSLATFLSTMYTVHKDSLAFLLSSLLGAAVNIVLNFVLIPTLGVSGAALASCISYMAVYFFRVFNTRRYIRLKVFRGKHWLGYLLLAAMGTVLYMDGVVGQIILVVLFAVNLYLSKDVFLNLLLKLLKRR